MVVVTNVTSFGRSGLSDFVVQRVSAVIIAVYVLCLAGFFVANPNVGFDALSGFFRSMPMKMFSTLAVLATAAHAWIGMWTIGTDYIRGHYFGARATTFRIIYQFGCLAMLFVYVLWALQIFWRT
jgi:succinate dehydrogenase / fumarate reductase, membrane anchor subunit